MGDDGGCPVAGSLSRNGRGSREGIGGSDLSLWIMVVKAHCRDTFEVGVAQSAGTRRRVATGRAL